MEDNMNIKALADCPNDNKVIPISGTAAKNLDKSDVQNANNIVAAYALMRKLLTQDTIISANLSSVYNKLQVEEGDLTKVIMDKMAPLMNQIGALATEVSKLSFKSSLAIGIGVALVTLSIVTGGALVMFLAVAGTLSEIAGNGLSIFENAQKIKAANLQEQVGQLEEQIGGDQAATTSISSSNKFQMSKLKELMKTQGSLNEVLNNMISEIAQAIQQLRQRVS